MADVSAQANLNTPNQHVDSPVAPTWDEAFLRVESYLRAYGLESRMRLNQITSEIIQTAQSIWHHENGSSPVLLSMQVTREKIDGWLTKIDLPPEFTSERTTAEARIALILADLPGRWSDHFLNSGALPAPFMNSIGTTRVLPTPEMCVSSMPPAPLNLGTEGTETTFALPSMSGFPHAALTWITILSFFCTVWAASH
ncbi:MAG: hypothetical protein QM715_03290 [Nibricoccus sp.]